MRQAFVLSILAILSSFFWNEWNLSILPEELSRNGVAVYTLDDVSYLRPFDSLYENGTLGQNRYQQYINSIRPPGYGLFYYFHLLLFGVNALKVMMMNQVILFGISVFALNQILSRYLQSSWLILLGTAIYGLLPWTMGFHYYTLSEGITSSLLLIGWWLLSSKTEKWGCYKFWIGVFVFAFLWVVRPVLLFVAPVVIFQVWQHFQTFSERTFVKKSLAILVLFSGLIFWQGFYFIKRGELIGLHPIYQNEIPGLFRPAHAAIWSCFKGWEHDGAHFHETIGPFWNAHISGDNSALAMNGVLRNIPMSVRKTLGEQRIRRAFELYASTIEDQRNAYWSRELLPEKCSENERKTIQAFSELEAGFKKHQSFTYYVITPLKVSKKLIAHSNLSLFLFQHPLRGVWWVEILRMLCFGLHFLLFFALLFVPFLHTSREWKMLMIFLFGYIFYLIYFQRGIEERYTAPILGLLLINFISAIECCKLKCDHLFSSK
jgi:hypothetical protein